MFGSGRTFRSLTVLLWGQLLPFEKRVASCPEAERGPRLPPNLADEPSASLLQGNTFRGTLLVPPRSTPRSSGSWRGEFLASPLGAFLLLILRRLGGLRCPGRRGLPCGRRGSLWGRLRHLSR